MRKISLLGNVEITTKGELAFLKKFLPNFFLMCFAFTTNVEFKVICHYFIR